MYFGGGIWVHEELGNRPPSIPRSTGMGRVTGSRVKSHPGTFLYARGLEYQPALTTEREEAVEGKPPNLGG